MPAFSVSHILRPEFANVYNNNNNNNNRDVLKKESERILNYKDFTTEIERTWNLQIKVIPVILGATGTVSDSFRKYLRNILGKHDIKELRNIAVLGIGHILREVLM
jgi:hypothetical protein